MIMIYHCKLDVQLAENPCLKPRESDDPFLLLTLFWAKVLFIDIWWINI